MSEEKDAPTSKRPNVVIIIADDMGYGDLSCYGSKLVETKHIDSIAKKGVRLTAGYASAPLCSPSRAGLITGRYQQRFGFEQQVSSGAFPERHPVRNADGSLAELQGEAEFLRRGIPKSEKNIAELFKAAGYKTGAIGKWHLGHGAEFLPQNRGFDHSVVFYGNTSLQSTNPDDPDMFSLKVDFHDEIPDTAWTREGLNEIRENGEIIDIDQYLLFYFRDRAEQYINENKDEPFLLYFAMNSPVPPLQVPRHYFDSLKETIPNIAVRGYNALLLAQDDAVGAILETLRRNGLEDDTIVVFVSDNGTATSRPGSNAPFSGGKFSTWEGGIRMPYVMQWPGQIPAGLIFSKPASTLDILPTVAAGCGVSTERSQPLDGVDLLPYFKGNVEDAPHEALFWKLDGYSAVRVGKWKLYLETLEEVAMLFDLEADPQELNDQSAEQPEVFEALKARYEAWEASLPPRAWTNYYGGFRRKVGLQGR
ncbi:sulfatase-like hydrolase/transferase [Pseudomonas sp. S37]|uniref:sulfatase-like hydrolase/transferase n=1 Tax=unclassified Pseudomonas TaxID=196821 RepID=UPI00191216D4|nr:MULTISPECIES: sulfatase-like hydrolase/transferase [unclassified Pseudomonas]MBK4987632.1 sulfatase-like hydrolase/transferase [Pseudomonas sp. S36]MBK4991921.1 sulfatase-like hydrolase/transferase [Pseudomonas sp. S37]MBK5006299.1 sulfatase-like hydrolase/transferase [Pseudomonas sp. S32]MBK5009536.1 sulfatase-like hydrolase/transferase [Pseudomonas sp. S60]